jgi:hypothetical protein
MSAYHAEGLTRQQRREQYCGKNEKRGDGAGVFPVFPIALGPEPKANCLSPPSVCSL